MAKFGSLPFGEQVGFFRRKLNINTQSWIDVLEAEHDTAFMVAGANRDDLVADFREAIRKAIDEGATLADFRKDFDRIVATHGWEYNGGRNWRSRVIYETNLRQSYNAGRWVQLQQFPYWRYRHSDAVDVPRPLHEAWDGMILRADDPWWLTNFPANGWGCQCYVEGLTERDMQKLGRTGPDTAPPLNLQDVTVGIRSPNGPRIVRTPEGVDPGFGYAPGRAAGAAPPVAGAGSSPLELAAQLERAAQQALEKSARLPIEQAAKSAADMLALPRAAQAIETGYVQWQAGVTTQAVQAGSYAVGAIEPAIARALVQVGIEPATAAIVVSEAPLAAALQAVGPSALTAAELAQLPTLLRTAGAVLLDREAGALVFVSTQQLLRGAARATVMVDYPAAGTGGANAFRSAQFVTLAELRARVSSGELQLLHGLLG